MRDGWEVESRALGLLVALYQDVVRLAGPAVLASLRDAIPRVEVRGRRSGVVVDVRVDGDGQEFVFRPSFERYPTADVAGTARAVLALVRAADEPVSIPAGSGVRSSGEVDGFAARVAHLRELQATLERLSCVAELVCAEPDPGALVLRVSHRRRPDVREEISCVWMDGEWWFAFGDGQSIGPAADRGGVAVAIYEVVSAGG